MGIQLAPTMLESDYTMNMSEKELPSSEVFRRVLSYLSDPISICRIACTCKSLSLAITTNGDV